MFVSNAYAAGGQPVGGGFISTLIFFGLFFLIFYFLLIMPQQKKQKEHKKMIENLQKGDNVVTVGGMHGTVIGIKDDVVTLKVAENVKLDFSKTAISTVVKGQAVVEEKK